MNPHQKNVPLYEVPGSEADLQLSPKVPNDKIEKKGVKSTKLFSFLPTVEKGSWKDNTVWDSRFYLF